MVRIGINGMSYIVLNCPCAYGFINEPMYCLWKDEVPIYKTLCQDCTDCVIKQVIEKCNIYKNFTAITINDYAKRELALHILDLFDIEEINK
jgi:hypothetical protein